MLGKLPYNPFVYLAFMLWFFAEFYFCLVTFPEPLGLTIACFIVWLTVGSPINLGAFFLFLVIVVPELFRTLGSN